MLSLNLMYPHGGYLWGVEGARVPAKLHPHSKVPRSSLYLKCYLSSASVSFLWMIPTATGITKRQCQTHMYDNSASHSLSSKSCWNYMKRRCWSPSRVRRFRIRKVVSRRCRSHSSVRLKWFCLRTMSICMVYFGKIIVFLCSFLRKVRGRMPKSLHECRKKKCPENS